MSASSKEQIAAEAVDWFLRLQGAKRSAADFRLFSEWLTRSPAHIDEYLAVSSTWVGLNVPDEGEFSTDSLIAAARMQAPTDVRRLEVHGALDRGLRHSAPPHRDRRRYWAGVAAAVILGCAAWLGYVGWRQSTDFSTAVGEQRSFSLPDGSVVILNTNSEVRVRWTASERHVDLLRGEGQFHVAKNPGRPFRVSTSIATVRAVGTVFDVRDDRVATNVVVLEGKVNVSAAGSDAPVDESRRAAATGSRLPKGTESKSIDLAAGERAAVTIHGIERNTGPTVEAVSAWTERRLVFRGQRLADVAAEFNRYQIHPLVIDDSALAELKISGVFDANDPESLLSYLRSFETAKVVIHPGDGSLHLLRGSAETDWEK